MRAYDETAMVLTNVWGERFALHKTQLPAAVGGSVALHATRM